MADQFKEVAPVDRRLGAPVRHSLVRLLIALLLVAFLLTGSVVIQLWLAMGPNPWGDNRSAGKYQFYPSSSQLRQMIAEMAEENGDAVSVEHVGTSFSGKPIIGVTLASPGEQAPEERPALFVIAQMHAREAISSQVLLYALDALLRERHTNELVAHLLATRTIYAIPQVNPDGNDIFLHQDEQQRGNARPADLDGDGKLSEDCRDGQGVGSQARSLVHFDSKWVRETAGMPFAHHWQAKDGRGQYLHVRSFRDMGYWDAAGTAVSQQDDDGDGKVNEDDLVGVDLNRNFPVGWEQGDSNPLMETYRGAAPLSEPESLAIRDFVLRHQNIVSAVSFHSGAEMILFPWGHSREPIPDFQLINQLARKAGEVTGTSHATVAERLYLSFGDLIDWLYQEEGILPITAEVYQAPQPLRFVRLWPTNWFLYYLSSGEQCNPPPHTITEHAQRWLPLVQFMLAALPEAYAANIRTENGEIVWEVGNAGLIGCDLHVQLMRDGAPVFQKVMQNVSEGSSRLAVPSRDGQYSLSVSPHTIAQIRPNSLPSLTYGFSIADNMIIGASR